MFFSHVNSFTDINKYKSHGTFFCLGYISKQQQSQLHLCGTLLHLYGIDREQIRITVVILIKPVAMEPAVNRCYPSLKLIIMLTSVWEKILTKGKVIF